MIKKFVYKRATMEDLSLIHIFRTLGIKPDVRRLFVYDNRMFAERAFSCRCV